MYLISITSGCQLCMLGNVCTGICLMGILSTKVVFRKIHISLSCTYECYYYFWQNMFLFFFSYARWEALSCKVQTLGVWDIASSDFLQNHGYFHPRKKEPTRVFLASFDHFASSDFNVWLRSWIYHVLKCQIWIRRSECKNSLFSVTIPNTINDCQKGLMKQFRLNWNHHPNLHASKLYA